MTTALVLTLTAQPTAATAVAPRPMCSSAPISGGELLFCAHHGCEHLPKLQHLATEIHDEIPSIACKRPHSADASMNASSAD